MATNGLIILLIGMSALSIMTGVAIHNTVKVERRETTDVQKQLWKFTGLNYSGSQCNGKKNPTNYLQIYTQPKIIIGK